MQAKFFHQAFLGSLESLVALLATLEAIFPFQAATQAQEEPSCEVLKVWVPVVVTTSQCLFDSLVGVLLGLRVRGIWPISCDRIQRPYHRIVEFEGLVAFEKKVDHYPQESRVATDLTNYIVKGRHCVLAGYDVLRLSVNVIKAYFAGVHGLDRTFRIACEFVCKIQPIKGAHIKKDRIVDLYVIPEDRLYNFLRFFDSKVKIIVLSRVHRPFKIPTILFVVKRLVIGAIPRD
jgi:hypothetical protein